MQDDFNTPLPIRAMSFSEAVKVSKGFSSGL